MSPLSAWRRPLLRRFLTQPRLHAPIATTGFRHQPFLGNCTRFFSTPPAQAESPATVAAPSKLGETERPTKLQLRRLFVNSMVPFVAFGIVDQSVLIYMGDFIDNTVGVLFGLPTLAAAAFGQIFSDTAGVTMGGTIEACAMKLGLPLPGLSEEQQKLGVVARIQTLGGVIGVITGCLIGMGNLLIIDLGSAERLKKAKELETIFQTVMEDGRTVVGCERATLWVVDEDKNELWSSVAQGVEGMLRIPRDGESIAALVAREKTSLCIADVDNDPRTGHVNHNVQGFRTQNMLVAPVVVDGQCVAVIQLLNKMEKGKTAAFDNADEKMVGMLAQHTSIFMKQLS